MHENKPRRPAGTFCPLWRKDVSKVCHTCDWWHSIAVQDESNPMAVRAEWGCAIVLSVMTQRSMHASIDGVQAATESFRNDMVRISLHPSFDESPKLIGG